MKMKQLTAFDINRIIKTSPVIRRILINQYELLGQHDIAEKIFNGMYFLLPPTVFDIPNIYTYENDVVQEVYKILDFYEKNNKQFLGFSNNLEPEYWFVAKAIFDDERFSSIKPSDMNSHIPMLDIYRKEIK